MVSFMFCKGKRSIKKFESGDALYKNELKYNIAKYLLFSLSGFTDWFEETDMTNLVLITVNDMYK